MGPVRRASRRSRRPGDADRPSPGEAAAQRARKPPRPRFGAPRDAGADPPPPPDPPPRPRRPSADRLGDLYDGWSEASLYGDRFETEEPAPPRRDEAVDEAFAVFGLEAEASWRDITRTHRRLAKRHHPDRWADASPDEQEEAAARMVDVNQAYATLRRHFGR